MVHDRLVDLAMEAFVDLGPRRVITGMALGWDMAVAEAAYALQIPYHAYIPFAGQDSKWPERSQSLYRALLKGAEEIVECSPPGYDVEKMMIRNRRMIDDCEVVLALWNGDKFGGTAHAIRYAQSKQRKIVNLWSTWSPS